MDSWTILLLIYVGAGPPRHPPRARGHPNSHPNSLARDSPNDTIRVSSSSAAACETHVPVNPAESAQHPGTRTPMDTVYVVVRASTASPRPRKVTGTLLAATT
jgi:hypothetical protein